MTDQQPPQFTLNELGAKFGAMLAQLLSENIMLEKLVNSQLSELQRVLTDKKDLKAELHQAQCNLIAAQGKAIIDNASADTE